MLRLDRIIVLHLSFCGEETTCYKTQYHIQVVVAGVVVTKVLFWTDTVTVLRLLVTDVGPGCYDHFN